MAEDNRNISATAKKYSVDLKRVREWDDEDDKLWDNNIGKVKKKRKLHSGGELCIQQLDNDTHLILKEERSEGKIMRNVDIKEKGIE